MLLGPQDFQQAQNKAELHERPERSLEIALEGKVPCTYRVVGVADDRRYNQEVYAQWAIHVGEAVILNRNSAHSARGVIGEATYPFWRSGMRFIAPLTQPFEDYRLKMKAADPKVFHIPEPAVLMSGYGDAAYSHFLFDCLGRLGTIEEYLPEGVKIVILEEFKGYQREFFASLNLLDRVVVVPNGKAALCDDLYVVSYAGQNNNFIHPRALKYLRTNLMPLGDDLPVPKRIYIDRSDYRSNFRRITNEDCLKKIAVDYGFKIFTPGNEPLSRKISMFTQADYIIGQYGGGVQNAFLCKPSARLLILQSPHFRRTLMSYIGEIVGFQVLNVEGEKVVVDGPPQAEPNNEPFSLNEDKFRKALEALLESSPAD